MGGPFFIFFKKPTICNSFVNHTRETTSHDPITYNLTIVKVQRSIYRSSMRSINIAIYNFKNDLFSCNPDNIDYYLKSPWELRCMCAITWSLGDFMDGLGNWRISPQGKYCPNKWHISCYVHVHNMKSPVDNIATGHVYLAKYPPGGVIIAYCIKPFRLGYSVIL